MTNKKIAENYRERLRAAREMLGISAPEMARRLLTPKSTYLQWESGARRTPGVAALAAEGAAMAATTHTTPIITDHQAGMSADISARYAARNLAIVTDRRAGMMFRDIAQKYGLSHQRASKICDGVVPGKRPARHAARNLAIITDRRAGMMFRDIAQKYGLSESQSKEICRNSNINCVPRYAARNLAIITDRRAGMMFRDIAQKYGLSCASIKRICRSARYRAGVLAAAGRS